MRAVARPIHPPTNVLLLLPSHSKSQIQSRLCRLPCSSLKSATPIKAEDTVSELEYKPGILDDFFLNSFRNKLIQEVGRDSEKPGYEGLIELAKSLLMKSKTNSDANEAAVRILKSFFPPFLLELYKSLIAPIAGGKIAALMVARVTILTCQWLMGPSRLNSVDLPDGKSWTSGVLVERCRYLEESKCVGVCINTCKLPTQSFFKDYMGVPLVMEPNFTDYSCQFKFGINPPLDDSTLKEPCLELCPLASQRKTNLKRCPKA